MCAGLTGTNELGFTTTVMVDTADEGDIPGESERWGCFHSISAMPAYGDKSHEELRFEDYMVGPHVGPDQESHWHLASHCHCI